MVHEHTLGVATHHATLGIHLSHYLAPTSPSLPSLLGELSSCPGSGLRHGSRPPRSWVESITAGPPMLALLSVDKLEECMDECPSSTILSVQYSPAM